MRHGRSILLRNPSLGYDALDAAYTPKIDPSTPAGIDFDISASPYQQSFTLTNVPANALIVILESDIYGNGLASITDNLATPLTYTKRTGVPNGSGTASEVWTAWCVNAQASVTVTVTGNGVMFGHLQPVVLTDAADPDQFPGAVNAYQSGTSSDTVSLDLQVSEPNSLVLGCFGSGWGGLPVPTPFAGQTMVFNGQLSYSTVDTNYTWAQRLEGPVDNISTVTFGATWTGTAQPYISGAVIEIRANPIREILSLPSPVANGDNSFTVTIPTGQRIPAGQVGILRLSSYDYGSAPVPTDTKGNTWTSLPWITDSGQHSSIITCYAPIENDLNPGDQINFTYNNYTQVSVRLTAVSGYTTLSDGNSGLANGYSSTWTSNTITAKAGDLLIGTAASATTPTPAAGWTSEGYLTGGVDPILTAYQVAAADGAAAFTGTLAGSDHCQAQILALRPQIKIDPSTPNAVVASSSSVTSNSFSPPANSLILVGWTTSGGAVPTGITDSLASHLTYKSLVSANLYGDEYNEIWVADAGSAAPGAMTVTVSAASSTTQFLGVVVLTGAAAAALQVGATNSGGSSSAASALDIATATTANWSQMFSVWSSRIQSGTVSATIGRSDNTDQFNGYVFMNPMSGVGDHYNWMVTTTTPTPVSGTTAHLETTIGSTPAYPSSEVFAAAAEVLPAPVYGAATPPSPAWIWPQATWRSAYR